MGRQVRLSVGVIAILAMLALSGAAIRDGVADSIVYAANVEMHTWDASGSQPGAQVVGWIRGDLQRAGASVPDDPTTHELLGVLATRELGDPANRDIARAQFREAVRLRPSSPYTWLKLAELRYRTGDTSSPFERDLRRAAELGPSEPEIQRVVVFLGLAVYDEVSEPSREVVDSLLKAGLRRNSFEMMQISSRRGRLDVACRFVQGMASEMDSKSRQFCAKARGATS